MLTVIGPDRPGIVQRVSQVVVEHGGSWQESRMARLAGHFAGILRVSVPAARVPTLSTALAALEQHGLRVHLSDGAAEDEISRARLVVDVMGQDRPGIVAAIASAVAKRDINVLELDSEVLSAPMSGDPMFKCVATLAPPAGADLDALRDELEALANDLHVEMALDRE